MSKKINLDDFFKELADKHQEQYDPKDWLDCQARLRVNKILSQSSIHSRLKLMAYTVSIILLFNVISTDNQYLITSFNLLANQNLKIPPDVSSESSSKNLSNPNNIKQQKLITPKSDLNETNFTTNNSIVNFNNKPANKPSQTPTLALDKNTYVLSEKDKLPNISESIADLNGKGIKETPNPFSNLPTVALPVLNQDEKPLQEKVWQIGLIHPLNTNGKKVDLNVVNRNSINLLLGMSAGLKGWEISGMGNYEQKFMQGSQFAGIFNACMNDVKGNQIAGLLNFAGNQLKGIQIAGLANLAGMKSNKSQELNANDNKFTAQIATLTNVDLHNPQDLQVSLVSNVANEVQGAQISPGINIANHVKGIQWSMTVNVAKKVDGVQLGILNVADSVNGVPIGLLSIVRKNGLQRLEVWTGETFQTNFGYKIGVHKFYNIFALSSQYSGTGFRWGLGYGIGTQLNLKNSSFVNLDLIAYHINEKIRFTRELNLLSQFRVNFNHRFGQKVNFFAGPTLNTLFSDFRNNDNSIGSRVAPWVLYTDNAGTTKVKMWVGFNFGMSF
jgi:hypothetical protein